jgi:uncharacterized phage protein gp47/JayE
VLAKELHEIEARLCELRTQVFPQTSTGVYLDRHAACRGLVRKEAVAGGGTLRFSRETASMTDIPIPAGTIVATRFTPQLQFATAEAGVLPAGQLSVLLPAVAVLAGVGGQVAAGAVCLLVSSLPGITGVTNPAPLEGGLDEENDEALRERLLTAYRNISNGTNAAYYHDIAMREPGVVAVNVIPRARGRGTVDVVVKCGSGASYIAATAHLAGVFAREREINVDVQVVAAIAKPVAVTAEIAFADEYESAAVADQCTRRVQEYASSLDVGEPLYLAKLYKLLLEIDGVKNVRIPAPAADTITDDYTALTVSPLSIRAMAVAE